MNSTKDLREKLHCLCNYFDTKEYTQNILLSGITFIPNPKTLQKIQYMNINSKIHEERVKILANQANTMDHDHFGFILEI